MVLEPPETDSELRDKLIAMVRSKIYRVAANHAPSPHVELITGDVERAVVRGIESIFKERSEV